MGLGNLENGPLTNLVTLKDAVTRRASSWDRSGRNKDNITIGPGETATLLEVGGPGCITHFYWTTICMDRLDLRRGILRMYWDGEDTPSVEVPLGDFFGAANGNTPVFMSEMMTINPSSGGSFGYNCYFPMPFSNGARITLTNLGDGPFAGGAYWYHIEYEQYSEPLPDTVGRFHAQFRRECLTTCADGKQQDFQGWNGPNLTGDENYVILETEGHGQLVGLVLNVDNVGGGWWGEGDDMIFVDGEPFPPRYHGTGSEEIFGGGACPNRPYFGPYTGFSTVQDLYHARNTTMYRWYGHDPVRFKESIRVTIEHGHDNNFENDYSSVAYWYQSKPAKAFPTLPTVDKLMPLPSEEEQLACSCMRKIAGFFGRMMETLEEPARTDFMLKAIAVTEKYYIGYWKESIAIFEELKESFDIES